MNIKELIKYFWLAWDMLIDLPLPKKVVDFSEDEARDLNVQRCFPLVGLALGIVILIIGKIFGLLNMAVATSLFAVFMTALTVLRDSGRSVGSLVSFIELKTEGVSSVAALYNMRGGINFRQPQSLLVGAVLTLVMFYYLVIYCFMMVYGFSYWMILVLVLSFTVQGVLAGIPSLGDRTPIIAVPRRAEMQIWYIAGFISLFVMFVALPGSIFATLVTFAIAFLGTMLMRKFCTEKLGGITANIIGFSGFIFEVVALLIGLVFLVK